MRKLMALDLDGTVLDHESNFPADLAQRLQEIDARNDIELVIATGRSTDATLPIVRDLGMHPEWVITCNGSIILRKTAAVNGYEQAKVSSFNPEKLLRRVHRQLLGAYFGLEGADGVFYCTREIPSKTLPIRRKIVDFEQLTKISATRVVVIAPEKSVSEFIESITPLGLGQVVYAVGDIAWLDMAPDGVNKASALRYVNEHVKIAEKNFFAAGDGDNDIEMLKWAGRYGVSVAMGQAPQAVKDAATQVTLPQAEGGLLKAIDKWLTTLS